MQFDGKFNGIESVKKTTAGARDARSHAPANLPSVDRLANHGSLIEAVEIHGRDAVVKSIQFVLAQLRSALLANGEPTDIPPLPRIAADVLKDLQDRSRPYLRPVFNLSGTVLHTNLGRAPLPEEALEAIRNPSARDALIALTSAWLSARG